MKQYEVEYIGGFVEIVEAYGYTKHGERVEFDLGRRCDKLICINVSRVELLS